MQAFNFKQIDNELINVPEFCLYSNEMVEVNLKNVNFSFDYIYVKINNFNLGKSTTGKMGIYSSKFIDGTNCLTIDYYKDNKLIKSFKTFLIKRPSIRGKDSIEQEYTLFNTELAKLKFKLDEIEKWKNEIDNERSGF